MSAPRPPLRIAFWAICAALMLTLLLTISDPYAVRQAMLAQTTTKQPAPIEASHNVSVAERTTRESSDGRSFVVSTDDEIAPANDSFPRTSPPHDPLAQTTTVSIPSEGEPHVGADRSENDDRPAMPILDPARLRRSDRRGEFVELPPPPGMGAQTVATDRAVAAQRMIVPLSAESADALRCLQLETDVLNLRHDLTRLTEDRQVDQLQRLYEQQAALAERQQQTAERLDQISGQMTAQAARLDVLVDDLDTLRTAPTTRSTAQLPATGEPELTPLENGQERFSLIIESENVADVLERWGHGVRNTRPATTTSPTSLNPIPDPCPQYLTPPAHN